MRQSMICFRRERKTWKSMKINKYDRYSYVLIITQVQYFNMYCATERRLRQPLKRGGPYQCKAGT